MKILYIEDDINIVEYLKFQIDRVTIDLNLQESFFDFQYETEHDLAVSKIINFKPDIIFADIDLKHGKFIYDILDDNEVKNMDFQLVYVSEYIESEISNIAKIDRDIRIKFKNKSENLPIKKEYDYEHGKDPVTLGKPILYSDLLKYLSGILSEKTRLLKKEFVKLTDITHVSIINKKTIVFINHKEPMNLEVSLDEMEKILNNKMFYRANDSHIVNLKYLEAWTFKLYSDKNKKIANPKDILLILNNINPKTIEKENKVIIPLSRKKQNEFLEKFPIIKK